jgi:hypothetical protein
MHGLFLNYEDAHCKLGLPGLPNKEMNCVDGLISSLKFTEKMRTYHCVRHRGRIVDYVGYAFGQINGNPLTNHNICKQERFLASWRLQNPIAVLKELKNGNVELLGYFKVHSFRKMLSNEGFTYFHFSLVLSSKRNSGSEIYTCA